MGLWRVGAEKSGTSGIGIIEAGSGQLPVGEKNGKLRAVPSIMSYDGG
jgi:hypothetical protein